MWSAPKRARAALRVGVAADHELLPALALDLEPRVRACAPRRRSGALGDDALEPRLGGGLEEGLAPCPRTWSP